MAEENPLIDTSNVTVSAFNAIKDKEKNTNVTLGKDDTTVWKSPNFKIKVKAWTSTDKKTHTYFHSLSIDVNVEDFMGTAEIISAVILAVILVAACFVVAKISAWITARDEAYEKAHAKDKPVKEEGNRFAAYWKAVFANMKEKGV